MRAHQNKRPVGILTVYAERPINIRDFDWCAVYEGDEGLAIGYGPSEERAVEDLITSHPVPDGYIATLNGVPVEGAT